VEMNDTAAAAWEKLRGTRWSPPRAASDDPARRRTYVFALEQAEQMFRAAATVGVATRPLQVFYGLSQAGRAIAAAAAVLVGDGWELSGHGIRCDPGSLRGPLPHIQLQAAKPGGKTSFVRLSELLGSPLWADSQQVTLSDLWDCLPDNRLYPLRDPSGSRTTSLYVDYLSMYAEPHPLISVPVAYFPPLGGELPGQQQGTGRLHEPVPRRPALGLVSQGQRRTRRRPRLHPARRRLG